MRIGLISNARSERNKSGLAGIDRVAADAGIVHLRFDGQRSLTELLRELAGLNIGLVVINAGDGTVQGSLTSLLEDRPFDVLPRVAILPRGMANMTAADVGLRGREVKTLRRLVEAATSGMLDRHLVSRRIVRVENIAGWPPQRGMFLGTAGIFEAIELCKGQVHKLGLKGEVSHAVTLAWLLLNAGLRGLSSVGMHGHDMTLTADGHRIDNQRWLLVLATTLDRLVLGSRPFWNSGGKPLRYTGIAHPVPSLLRNVRKVLYGGETRALPAREYESGGASRLELSLDSSFTIDGQFFEPKKDVPLIITAADSVQFVRL